VNTKKAAQRRKPWAPGQPSATTSSEGDVGKDLANMINEMTTNNPNKSEITMPIEDQTMYRFIDFVEHGDRLYQQKDLKALWKLG
jgi:hypothetical protein